MKLAFLTCCSSRPPRKTPDHKLMGFLMFAKQDTVAMGTEQADVLPRYQGEPGTPWQPSSLPRQPGSLRQEQLIELERLQLPGLRLASHEKTPVRFFFYILSHFLAPVCTTRLHSWYLVSFFISV